MNPIQSCHRICTGLMSRARNLWYRALGVHIIGYVWMRRISITGSFGSITLEPGVALDEGVTLQAAGEGSREKIVIRSGTFLNRYTIVSAGERVEIGHNCLIGPHCFIGDGIHGTSPDRPVKEQPTLFKPIVIEDDVWLGAGCVVLAGVRLGKGCVIGAGSVVSQDIPPGMIAVSGSARVIKARQ